MKYLVDTDRLIDFLHGKEEVVYAMKRIIPQGVALSAIAVCEYFYGVNMSTSPRQEKDLFWQFVGATDIPILSIDNNVALRYGELQAGLARKGLKGGLFDVLVGATALEHDLVLYTGNVKDFSKIEGLQLLEAIKEKEKS